MRTRRMHGFMCQSQASTAVCIPGDARSVVVPRRPDRTLVDDASWRTVDFRYSRLVDTRRLGAPSTAATAARAERKKRLQVITLPAGGGEKRLQVVALPTRAKAAPPAPPLAKSVKEVGFAPPALPTTGDPGFQVVVMRVSIHCQGCAGKVKKLLSKMEGVTSFSIDLEAKRVTVMGHVSPVGVLESISKVKKAEFWPNPTPSKANFKAEPASLSLPQIAISSSITP